MGLFDKLKKNKSGADWNNAFKANPHFYSKPDVFLIRRVSFT